MKYAWNSLDSVLLVPQVVSELTGFCIFRPRGTVGLTNSVLSGPQVPLRLRPQHRACAGDRYQGIKAIGLRLYRSMPNFQFFRLARVWTDAYFNQQDEFSRVSFHTYWSVTCISKRFHQCLLPNQIRLQFCKCIDRHLLN